MRQTEKKSSVYDYLEPVLEAGSEEDIALARKKYWNLYKANWRKQRRMEQKEFTVYYSHKELQIITRVANKHNRSRTRFIKEAVLAYCKTQCLIPDPFAVNRIRELLALNYNSLQQFSEENTLQEKDIKELMDKMTDLEKNVLASLNSPKSLEQWITEAIEHDPENKTKILELLQTLPDDY